MKHMWAVISVIFVSSLITFSQTSDQRGSDNEPKQQVLRSPMMGFEEESDDPFRMLYSGTFAVKGDNQKVETMLEPKNLSGKAVRAFTVYCEEEFSQRKDGNVVKEVHRITAKEIQPVFFQVQKDSILTFWVGSIQFDDGVVWFNR